MRRSTFNWSHEFDFTCNMGEAVPILCQLLPPGGVFRQDVNLLLRTQPLQAPVFAKCDIDVRTYAIPLRILQDKFEDFITGGLDGLQAPAAPMIDAPAVTGWPLNSLADYLGYPTGVPNARASVFPMRAYAEVMNNYYLDEQLQTQLVVSKGDGTDTTTSTALQNGCWNPDYFTKARKSPQLGTPVGLPLVGDAPVRGTGKALGLTNGTSTYGMTASASGSLSGWTANLNTNVGTASSGSQVASAISHGVVTNGAQSGMEADMSGVSAVDINELTEAAGIQRYKVKANRGARYPEWLRSFFGISPQDSRMQWPEYLGGGKAYIQFSEVLQTAEGTDPVGELRGHGIATAKSNTIKYFAQEHCIIMTIMCVRPKTQYFQGTPKWMTYTSKYDYLIPDLQNLGDQPILNKEIFTQGTSVDDEVWGFTPKYEEYRSVPSRIAGDFKSTLDFWHMARDFSALPPLNGDFVKSNPTDRIYATDAAQLQIRAIHKIKTKLPLSKVARQSLK